MKGFPVVEVVEVHGILDVASVLDVVFAEDGFAGAVVVNVAGDGGIELTHGFGVEASALLREHPGLALRIGRLLVRDVAEELLAVDADAVEDHLVISFTAGRIVVMEFSHSAEGGFLPEAGQVEYADGAGDAGTDHGNEFHVCVYIGVGPWKDRGARHYRWPGGKRKFREDDFTASPVPAIRIATPGPPRQHGAMMKLLLSAIFALTILHGQPAAAESLAIPVTDDGLPGAGPVRRYDWFQKLWLEKRTAWASRQAQDRGAVVFFGDSITEGWGDDFGGSFPGMKAANRGISGDTTRGMLLRLKDDVLSVGPAAVVLLMGTNDLEEKAAPETIAGNLKLILDALHAHNALMPVILCQVFPSAAAKSRPAEQIKKINALYAAAVKGRAQVTMIETWLQFANAEGDAKPEEFPDLLHPNKAGYDKWAAALRPVLETLGVLKPQPDNFKPEDGFVSLFNGKDLTGWGYNGKNGHETFDGKPLSRDGRYQAVNGRLVVTTPPEYSKITQLWTAREFPKNFVLKLEFRATPNADSGIFLRQPQLQCRDYSLAGPWKNLPNYKPQQWNEVVVTVKDNIAHCTCNGDVLDAAFKLPPTGPIGLEGDRGQMEYRRIPIQEMP